MPPILGNAIALAFVLALVYACVRTLRRDRQRGGCAACGACSGTCAGCGKCGGAAATDALPVIDVEALRKK